MKFLRLLLPLLSTMALGHARTFNSEYELLRQIPPDLFQALTNNGEPDANGLVGAHRKQNRWYESGKQRSGCWYLIGAVVAGDEARADRAWTSIEATFARQLPDGGFLSNQQPNRNHPPTFEERVETAFFYLQELGHALLVVRKSPLAGHFENRIVALEPKLRRACAFIDSGYDTIFPKVGHTTNRLFIAAKAFGLCGVVLKDEALQARARELVKTALSQRDADGVFLEKNGRDSSYNAVSLLMARVLWLHLPIEGLDEALVRAMAWERTRITPEGDVIAEGNTRTGLGQEKSFTGGIKQINRREVALALCYHALVHDDPGAVDLAAKVFAAGGGRS
jgi:hypothetical protein